MSEVYRAVLTPIALLLVALAFTTYVPWLSTWHPSTHDETVMVDRGGHSVGDAPSADRGERHDRDTLDQLLPGGGNDAEAENLDDLFPTAPTDVTPPPAAPPAPTAAVPN